MVTHRCTYPDCKNCEQENKAAQKARAKKQEDLVGEHYCPDWDELFLKKGSMEFCVCNCTPENASKEF